MAHKDWNFDFIDKALEAYLIFGGYTIEEFAEKLNINAESLGRYLKGGDVSNGTKRKLDRAIYGR